MASAGKVIYRGAILPQAFLNAQDPPVYGNIMEIREVAEDGLAFEKWDGSTMCSSTYISGQYEKNPRSTHIPVPSKKANKYVTVYGPNSLYCLKLSAQHLTELYWRAKHIATEFSELSLDIPASAIETVKYTPPPPAEGEEAGSPQSCTYTSNLTSAKIGKINYIYDYDYNESKDLSYDWPSKNLYKRDTVQYYIKKDNYVYNSQYSFKVEADPLLDERYFIQYGWWDKAPFGDTSGQYVKVPGTTYTGYNQENLTGYKDYRNGITKVEYYNADEDNTYTNECNNGYAGGSPAGGVFSAFEAGVTIEQEISTRGNFDVIRVDIDEYWINPMKNFAILYELTADAGASFKHVNYHAYTPYPVYNTIPIELQPNLQLVPLVVKDGDNIYGYNEIYVDWTYVPLPGASTFDKAYKRKTVKSLIYPNVELRLSNKTILKGNYFMPGLTYTDEYKYVNPTNPGSLEITNSTATATMNIKEKDIPTFILTVEKWFGYDGAYSEKTGDTV